MGGRVLLQDLIQGVARRADISEQEAETFVRTVLAVISDSLGDDKIVKIRNLGTFKLVEVDDRETVDPESGIAVRVKGYRKIVFSPDNTLKDLINKPFAQFETVVLNDATDTADMERGTEPLPGEEEDPEEENEEIVDEDTVVVENTESESNEVPADVLETVEADPVSEEEYQDPDGSDKSTCTDTNERIETENSMPDSSESEDNVSDESVRTDDAVDPASEEKEKTAEETPGATGDEETHTEEEIPAASIEYQHADYQKVQDQKVDELNVSTQNVEHQTIEHQSIVHQARTENERSVGCMRLTQGGMIALFLFILVLMAGSYLAGYYRVLLPACHTTSEKVYQDKPRVVGDSVKVVAQPKQTVSNTVADTVKQVAKTSEVKAVRQNAADSLKRLKANAAKYPQVKDGNYLIVGVKTVHKLKSGESLLRLAQKVYGSRDFVKYIIILNKIKDPDLVQIGAEIKLPELVKSSDKS